VDAGRIDRGYRGSSWAGGGGFRGGRWASASCWCCSSSAADRRNFLSLVDPNAIAVDRSAVQLGPVTSSPDEDRLVQFVTFVLNDAQATWARLLPG
jgi:hypothetical protein